MLRNPKPYAVVELGAGVVCVVTTVGSFLNSPQYFELLRGLTLGAALLLYGLSNNNSDKSERGKMFSNAAAVLLIVSTLLYFYNIYFNSK